jgi:hypothetical protein
LLISTSPPYLSPFPLALPLSFQISIDVVGLVDEWAARFFEELDYVNEGENGILFAEMMRKDLPQVNPITISKEFLLEFCLSSLVLNHTYNMKKLEMEYNFIPGDPFCQYFS